VRRVQRCTKCTECEYIRDALAKCGTDDSRTAPLRSRRRTHLEMVSKERREYQKKCEQAALYPSKFTSLIVDGADQSGYGLPHFTVTTKATVGHGLKVKLIGVLEHGSNKNLSLYTMTPEFETGANHIIEALHRTLAAKDVARGLKGTLYLQVDNCTRENKNTFLFSYVECLVAWGVFVEVHVSFLPIGHTHSDIDQTFSCTSKRLASNTAVTIDDLHSELRKSFTPQPAVTRMLHLINFSSLCKNEGIIGKVQPFSKYRYFRFHRIEGEPQCIRASYRTACSVKIFCGDQWAPLQTGSESQAGFILKTPDLSMTPPTPARSPPDRREVDDRFRSEETRIDSHRKLQMLHDLADHVYKDRDEPFHWNLSTAFELHGTYRSREFFGDEEGEDDLEIGQETPQSDLTYTVNHFVAVNGESCTDELLFWLGQILDTSKNLDGVTVQVLVRWYEVYNKKDAWTGKYQPAMLSSGRGRKPWTGLISVESIIAEFPSLTEKRLRASAEKEIIAGLSSLGRQVQRSGNR